MTTDFPFFPVAAPGETVFSVIGRCSERSGLAAKHLLFHLTGQHRKNTSFAALPGHLKFLAEAIPEGHPWKEVHALIQEHTSLPYFTYFYPPTIRAELINLLAKTEISQRVAMALGLTQYRCTPSPKHPRFCTLCIQEDEATTGFAYFHREHQLPGLAICWKHDIELMHGCKTCGTYPLLGKAFSMPGRCLCSAFLPLPAYPFLPPEMESLAWISRESAKIVSSTGSPHVNTLNTLRRCLIDKGLCNGSLLAYGKIAYALENRYGASTLEWLGYHAWTNGKPSPWIRKIFTTNGNHYKRISSLTHLLMLGIVFDSVNDFEFSGNSQPNIAIVYPTEVRAPDFLHNNLKICDNQADNWKVNLISRLQRNNFRIAATASEAGVSSYSVAVEARRQKIKVPLSDYLIKRLGSKQIEDIREKLRVGIQKKEIQKTHNIGEWTLFLIELDDLKLNLAHRKASFNNILELQRNKVRKLISHTPSATRTMVMTEMPGTYDLLIRKDKQWFCDQLPIAKRVHKKNRPLRTDWAAWDRNLAKAIREQVIQIHQSDVRPYRITVNSLLKSLEISSKRKLLSACRLPEIQAVLNEVTETKSSFLERKILWGIKKMARENRPVSINTLRREIGTTPENIRERKQFVIDAIERLGATTTALSYFN